MAIKKRNDKQEIIVSKQEHKKDIQVAKRLAELEVKKKLFKKELETQLNTIGVDGQTPMEKVVNKFINNMLNDKISNKDFIKHFELLARISGAIKNNPLIENTQRTVFVNQDDINRANEAINNLINVNKEDDSEL